MERIINVKVKGNHLTKDSNNAGTRGEANVTTLRITFGDDWNAYVKKILFWDAHGMNPTKRTLVHDGKEPANVYLHNIPKSALGLAGDMTFRIDGCIDNKRQVSVSATLEVGDALIVDGEEEIPKSDLDNVREKIEELKQTIIDGVKDTETAAGNAKTSAGQAAEAQKEAQEAALAAVNAKGEAETAKGVAQDKALWAVTACGDAQKAQSEAEAARDVALAHAGVAETFKKDAEKARNEARVYADNFDSLAEAVSRAEGAASDASGHVQTACDHREAAESAKEDAEAHAAVANAAVDMTNEVYDDTVEARDEAVSAKNKAVEALANAQTIQTNLNNALPKINNAVTSANKAAASEANAKSYSTEAQTYANNAENAVSQSRYIGANGNWYVWDSSKKTFVDSGETAHAGSIVYVGSNPPSNAQVWIDPNGDGDISMSIKEIYNTIKSMKPKAVTITLLSSAWVVDGDRYAQIVSIPEATAYSKVDLQPSAEQLTIFHEKDIAFVTENVGGTITVYCIGQKPTNDYTIQATITEVSK